MPLSRPEERLDDPALGSGHCKVLTGADDFPAVVRGLYVEIATECEHALELTKKRSQAPLRRASAGPSVKRQRTKFVAALLRHDA